jgi:hypothetical protein
MATYVYNNAKGALINGTIDLNTDDIRVLLTTSSYSPDIDADTMVSHVDNECSGSGYARKALSGETVTVNNTDNRADFSANNLTWTAANFGTPAYAVLYKYNSAATAAALICCVDLTPAVATNGGDYTVKWNGGSSSGDILRLS